MTVIPAEAGNQTSFPRKRETSIRYENKENRLDSHSPIGVGDKLRGNDECLIRYFTHDTTLGINMED
jgi:hypothetical protein